MTQAEVEASKKRKTITVKGYPLTATPLDMINHQDGKPEPIKKPSPLSKPPNALASYRSSQGSCESGAQDAELK
jgi:hypothetical protein